MTTSPRTVDRFEQYGTAAVATAGVGVLAVGLNAVAVGFPCPLLATTGVPCPGCGMTRLADAVVHGNIGHAVTTDPAGLMFLVLVGVLGAAYLLHRASSWRPPAIRLGWIPATLTLLLGLHWLTTLLTGGFVHA